MAIARLYQDEAIEKARAALRIRRSATVVAPTGAGKTVIAGIYIDREAVETPDSCFLFVQHTEELLDQNRSKVAQITGLPCSTVMGKENDWTGRVVFASIPTIQQPSRIVDMRKFTHMIVDEAHHSAAISWARIIDHARRLNPKMRILALSATPERGDGKPLPKSVGRIVHRIWIQELIDLGHLCPPRAYSVLLGDSADRISRLRASDVAANDQTEVAKILDTPEYNAAVVDQWKAKAEGRPTIAFCSTVAHARHVAEAFQAAGVPAAYVDHNDKAARRKAIAAFKAGEIKVIANCMLLTEGFDHQPTSCVLILRAMLHSGTFVQALGRALRVVDASIHPGVVKYDALCLDYSGAAVRHAQLDTKTHLPVEEIDLADVANDDQPISIAEIEDMPPAEEESFVPVLQHVDLSVSQFRWTDIHGDGRTLVASGLSGFAAVMKAGSYYAAVGQPNGGPLKVLHMGGLQPAFAAASDWIRANEKDDRAVGSRAWLRHSVTIEQRIKLARRGYSDADAELMDKYEASCHIRYIESRKDVVRHVSSYLSLAQAMETTKAA